MCCLRRSWTGWRRRPVGSEARGAVPVRGAWRSAMHQAGPFFAAGGRGGGVAQVGAAGLAPLGRCVEWLLHGSCCSVRTSTRPQAESPPRLFGPSRALTGTAGPIFYDLIAHCATSHTGPASDRVEGADEGAGMRGGRRRAMGTMPQQIGKTGP